jgi:formamidopyrimidine-DNA glycosylase
MPELPEVQTVVSDLNRKIVGDTITDFWSDWSSSIKNKTVVAFKKEIKNRKILGVRRIGKNIFIDLSGGKTLYIHLKMTGHLLIKSQNTNNKSQTKYKTQNTKSKKYNYFSDKVNQYIHHIWYLKSSLNHLTPTLSSKRRGSDKEKTLEFSDVRKFAKIVLDDTQKISQLPEIKKLGIDALDPKLTLKKFQEILRKKKDKAIGLVLMEQELISGIGNIYRSEILFAAGLMPIKMVKELKESEWQKLYISIKRVLKKAIKMRGTSDSDYRDTSGAPGNFQKALQVYKKNGKNCVSCGIIIKRQKLGQRSLFFCPKCQK